MISSMGGLLVLGLSIVGILTIVAPSAASVAAKRIGVACLVVLVASTFSSGFGGGFTGVMIVLAAFAGVIGAVLYVFDPARGIVVWTKTVRMLAALLVLRISVAMLWASAIEKALLIAVAATLLFATLRRPTNG